ncbi:hypothetical protein V6N12_047277 [Hibiscus sabdariffa]|uniref:Uncharacterized protein n=1 Tax=Hibiscus sabdariffa TaxID=183260 RepID=A0ABR2DAE0_9ROSI
MNGTLGSRELAMTAEVDECSSLIGQSSSPHMGLKTTHGEQLVICCLQLSWDVNIWGPPGDTKRSYEAIDIHRHIKSSV